MKKLFTLGLLVISSLMLAACGSTGSNDVFGPDEEINGYDSYTLSGVQSAVDSGDDVILFVGATWCPPCVSLHKDIIANAENIPDNVKIFAVDIDQMDDKLKSQLDVTKKHTTIYLNHDGSVYEKRENKEYTLQDILDFLASFHTEDNQNK